MKLKYSYIERVFTEWNELKNEGIYFSGKRKVGTFKRWFSFKNELVLHCLYNERGELDGEYRAWWDVGILYKHCFYKDNRLDGEYKQWNTTGQLEIHKSYKDGREIKDYLV